MGLAADVDGELQSQKQADGSCNPSYVHHGIQSESRISEDNTQSADGTTSTAAAVFIVVNAAMGAGLLNFPNAFGQAGGLAPAIVMEMVSLLLEWPTVVIQQYGIISG